MTNYRGFRTRLPHWEDVLPERSPLAEGKGSRLSTCHVLGSSSYYAIGQVRVSSILFTCVVKIDLGGKNCRAKCGNVYRGFESRTSRAGLR